MRFLYLLTLAISFSTLELSAQCYDQKTIISGNLKIFDRWVRQMPKSYNSTAGYLKIQNMGETEVELLRVETNFTGETEFHIMQEQYGVIMMRCEQTHRVSKMPKPKLRPEPDFDS